MAVHYASAYADAEQALRVLAGAGNVRAGGDLGDPIAARRVVEPAVLAPVL
jgi:hypothetical protein